MPCSNYAKPSRIASCDRCRKLFQSGTLKWNVEEASAIWEPDGCALQYRSMNEAANCMNDLLITNKKVPFLLFVGDSRIQQLRDGLILTLTGHDYDTFANRLAVVEPESYAKYGAPEKIYRSAGAQIKFEWQPYLDDGAGAITNLLWNISKSEIKPDILVLGAGIWSIKDCEAAQKPQQACAETYREHLRILLPLLNSLATTTLVIWTPQCAVNEIILDADQIHFGYTNTNMQRFNDVAREVLSSGKFSPQSSVIFWESAWEASVQINDGVDGIHLGHETKLTLVQMLLDWICSPVRRDPTRIRNAKKVVRHSENSYCCHV
ncbi:putative CAS1 domain-containing protein 1 [Hypsibius exemplaris]|uniref:CAS1 domain-containing protein 1 n=1 Tax=Hypsibius exemplaris TaxID=2072580 RepID=A0A1W0W8S7_HYPEX|nr:putative CAS1 domain-containing protein 1 [Hypsibius exemplaris]